MYIRSEVVALQINRAEKSWLELHVATFKNISTEAQIIYRIVLKILI